jgi:hypothetical protein
MAFGSIGMPGTGHGGPQLNVPSGGKMIQHMSYTCPGLHGPGC